MGSDRAAWQCHVLYAFIGIAGALQAALEKVLEKPKELVVVDLDKKLTEKGLSALFPVETWPPTFAVGHVVCVG